MLSWMFSFVFLDWWLWVRYVCCLRSTLSSTVSLIQTGTVVWHAGCYYPWEKEYQQRQQCTRPVAGGEESRLEAEAREACRWGDGSVEHERGVPQGGQHLAQVRFEFASYSNTNAISNFDGAE